MISVRLRRAALGLPVALLAAMVSRSAEATIAYDVSVGVSETDNVRLTPNDRRSDTITTAGFDVVWHEQRRLFNADVIGDLAYLDYLRGSFSPGVVGNLVALGRLNLIQDRLTWSFSDNFGQALINPLAQVTPQNRENVNYFSTGPDLTLPLGSVAEFLADARYANVNYQISPLSSNRYTAGVGIKRDISTSSAVSLNVQDELIRFDNHTLDPDYDQQSAYVRYNAHGVRTRLDIQLGASRVKLPNETTTTALVRIAATRQISPFSSLTLAAGHEFSDAGDDFRLLQALGGQNLLTQAVSPTADPFKNAYVTLAWDYKRQRTGFGLSAGYYRMVYLVTTSLNEHRPTAEGHISRELTPMVEATVQVTYYSDNFDNTVGNAHLLTGALQVAWRTSRHWSIVTEYDYARRQSELRQTEYRDNVIWVKLRYGRVAQAPQGAVVPRLPLVPNQTGY